LNEQPIARQSKLRFICLTDDASLRSESWEIRLVEPAFEYDAVRSQRDFKIRPHLHMHEFSHSIYIDNSVILQSPPEFMLDLAAASPDGMLIIPHSFRETVLDEFLEVSRQGLDDGARIHEQLNHYELAYPDILQERPWWTAIMVRDHRNMKVRTAMELWALHVMRYARRDQLSVNLALHLAGVEVAPLLVDNHSSDFHRWPHIFGRNTKRRTWNASNSMMPLSARLREATQQADELKRERDETTTRLSARLHEATQQADELKRERDETTTRLSARLHEATQQADELKRERDETTTRLNEVEALLNAVLSSTWWRILSPVRMLLRRRP